MQPMVIARREFLGAAALVGVAALPAAARAVQPGGEHAPVEIGSRRELFVDRLLIEALGGEARLRLAQPRDEGVVLPFDAPWEGAFCGYCTVLRDNERYLAWYRGLPQSGKDGSDAEVTCVAESRDGVTWHKPRLGLFEVRGARDNNVVLAGMAPFSHNFCPMRDTAPGVPAEARFKAVGGTSASGLAAFASEDGLRWRKLRAEPVFRDGAFDSQNVPFWSAHEQRYCLYFRVFKDGIRRIARTTSADFLNWDPPVLMEYGNAPVEQLYTNQTLPYMRAPHISIAIAARFFPGRQVLSAEQARAIQVDPQYFSDCSDGILMSTRGGNMYDRAHLDAFVRPGIGLNNWVSRTNYPALGVVQTGPTEMSFYVNQNYGQPTAHLRRYSLRLDGFASVNAPWEGGELVTPPVIFKGNVLSLNFATSAAGGIWVELQDARGLPLKGYGMEDSQETIGNEIERVVHWRQGSSVARLAGTAVRLRFRLKDADLYAFQFRDA
jgi:hypothetical protein